jgi:hypothetical protein
MSKSKRKILSRSVYESRWEQGDKKLRDVCTICALIDLSTHLSTEFAPCETLFERSESFVAASFDAPMNGKSECLTTNELLNFSPKLFKNLPEDFSTLRAKCHVYISDKTLPQHHTFITTNSSLFTNVTNFHNEHGPKS